MNAEQHQFMLTFEQFTKLDLTQLNITVVGTDNEYGIKYTCKLYKIQVKHPSIQTFYCARRYNEFYALHKVLKIKYSNLELPAFPSKHEFFNRVEKRKAGFHLLLNRLVLIAHQHPQIANNILKLLYFFLTRELSGQQKQHIMKQGSNEDQRSSLDEEDDIAAIEQTLITEVENLTQSVLVQPASNSPKPDETNKQKLSRSVTGADQIVKMENHIQFEYHKEIKNYSGNILMRFSEEEEWQQFYGKIKNGSLQLYNHISQNYFSCQIFLFQAQIDVQPNHLLIYHSMDYKKIQLKVPTQVKEKVEFVESSERNLLLTWQNQLQFAAIEQVVYADEVQDDFNSIGKIQLHIKEALNLKNVVADSFLSVRIKFKPFLCQTKQHVFAENPQWRQDFILPINDSYGVITMEVISEVQDGILSRKIRSTVIGTAEILIADILSYHSDTKFQRIVLDLQNCEEVAVNPLHQLFHRKNSDSVMGESQKKPQLVVTLRNMSSWYSVFAAPPIHFYEGDKQEPDFTLFKMNIIRFKRIIYMISTLLLQLEDIVDRKYPRFTLFIFSLMFIFIYFADLNNILTYIVFMLIFIMTYQHPALHPIFNQFFDTFFFSYVNPTYLAPQIYTIEEKDLKRNTQSLDKVFKFENNEIIIDEDDEKDIKDKEGLYQRIRAMKKQFFVFQVYLTYFSNGAEKIINLFTWGEYQRTMYFSMIVVVAFCLIKILPLRYIMMAGIINEWFDSGNVFRKRQQHNYKIGKAIMEYIYCRYAPEMVKITNYLDLEFPKGDSFKLKIVHELKLHLQLSLTMEDMAKYQTGNQIIRDLTTCFENLKFLGIIDHTFVRDQLYYELRSKGKYKIKPHYLLLYTFSNFLYNIPSQYYRLRHPRVLKK